MNARPEVVVRNVVGLLRAFKWGITVRATRIGIVRLMVISSAILERDEVEGSEKEDISCFPASTKTASIKEWEARIVAKEASRVVRSERSMGRVMRPGSSVCRAERRSRRRPAAKTVLPWALRCVSYRW